MKQKFGIDIDDTLIKVWGDDIFKVYNTKYGTSLSFNDLKTHNFNGDSRLREEFFNFFYSNHHKLPLYDGVKKKLNQLRRKFDLYLITSRPQSDVSLTLENIEIFFGKEYFREIIFTCLHNDSDKKCEISDRMGFDVVIDDAPHHIENYINNTKIKTIFIFDQPWNRAIVEDNERVHRIKKWDEVNL